jgi:hypothetical protein
VGPRAGLLKFKARFGATTTRLSSNGGVFRSKTGVDTLICHCFLNTSVPVVTKYPCARKSDPTIEVHNLNCLFGDKYSYWICNLYVKLFFA